MSIIDYKVKLKDFNNKLTLDEFHQIKKQYKNYLIKTYSKHENYRPDKKIHEINGWSYAVNEDKFNIEYIKATDENNSTAINVLYKIYSVI